MIFCQILDNKAYWIFEADTIPEFSPDIIIKDITNVNPQPQEGWSYDSTTNTFTASVVPTPTLASVQATKKQLITDAYNNALSAGFTSNASGTAIQYPYNTQAEQTFDELYLALMSNQVKYPQNVYDINDNAVAFTNSTQLTQLYTDIFTFKAGLNTKMHTYLSQIDTCTDAASVQAINWS
jgi:PKD repeat protein